VGEWVGALLAHTVWLLAIIYLSRVGGIVSLSMAITACHGGFSSRGGERQQAVVYPSHRQRW
jgi:hypothetical protein